MGTKLSKQPSLYPTLSFHSIRIAQFLSSAIVLGILSFFIHYLQAEEFYIPWTFILLLTVSTLTLTFLLITAILHNTRTLPPRINLGINAFHSLLWALGFAFLTWNISSLLGDRCSRAKWHSDAGIMICRMYKALTAFTITGLISTTLALGLDFRTHGLVTRRGKYNPMQDVKAPISLPVLHTQSYNEEHAGLSRPYKAQRPVEVGQLGYSAPSEQSTYGRGGF